MISFPGGGVALYHASKELDKLQTTSLGGKIGVQLLQQALKVFLFYMFVCVYVWFSFTDGLCSMVISCILTKQKGIVSNLGTKDLSGMKNLINNDFISFSLFRKILVGTKLKLYPR